MSDLGAKLETLGDTERVQLYRELMDRVGDSTVRPVRELVLVYQEDAKASPEKLKELAATRLPSHEHPTRFVAAKCLPRTSHGKIDRRGLPGLVRTRKNASAPHDAGHDPNVSAAVDVFRQVLGTESAGPDANFFEAGGHSLSAVEFILKFREATGRQVSITQFLNHPTPRGVAALLNRERPQSLEYIYPVSDIRSGLPVFVFSANRLAYALKSRRPDWTIYGIQMRWRDDQDRKIPYGNLEALGARIADEIDAVCKGGDFILAGSSFSAVVAFEVAKQLRSRQTTPRLTILIEPTVFPGIRSLVERDLMAQGQLREGDKHILMWLLLNNPLRRQFWRRIFRFAEIELKRLRSRGKAAQKTANKPLSDRDAAAAQFAMDKAHLTALWRKYRPSSYSGPAVLIVGQHGWRYQRDWRVLLDDERAMHCMDADHAAIVREPFLSDNVVPVFCTEVDSAVRRETERVPSDGC